MREYKFDINAIDLTFPLVKSSIICILSFLYLNTLNILKRVQKMFLQDKFWKQKYYKQFTRITIFNSKFAPGKLFVGLQEKYLFMNTDARWPLEKIQCISNVSTRVEYAILQLETFRCPPWSHVGLSRSSPLMASGFPSGVSSTVSATWD